MADFCRFPMEKEIETPLKDELDDQSQNCNSAHRAPLPHHASIRDKRTQNSSSRKHKLTPELIKIPEALKYQERYKSPTDFMMSPVSKDLLARSRKTVGHLPPAKNPLKQLFDAGQPQI